MEHEVWVQRSLQAQFLGRDSGSVLLGGIDPRVTYYVSEAVAECLHSLTSPTSLATLLSQGPLERESAAKLLNAGLLVEAADDCAESKILSHFFPRFLGCPEGVIGEGQVCVIGVPFDNLSQTGSGARAGPAALRVASSLLDYRVDDGSGHPLGWFDSTASRQVLRDVTFVDAGDIDPEVGESIPRFASRILRAGRICAALGSLPVFLGGDHSISYWAITAIRRVLGGQISVLHLDAHSDLGEETGAGVPTNGSVARWLIVENPDMPFVTAGFRGFLRTKQPLLSRGHKLISAADLARNGSDAVLSSIPETMPCYISFDIDVLDPAVAPGSNVVVPGGLSFDQVRELLVTVASQRSIVGVDIVELNPERDPYSRSASAAVHLVLALLGSYFSNSTAN